MTPKKDIKKKTPPDDLPATPEASPYELKLEDSPDNAKDTACPTCGNLATNVCEVCGTVVP